jgi:hypothetical protein
LTTCSKEVTVGTTGPIGSGLPQLGLPRRFAMYVLPSAFESDEQKIRRPVQTPSGSHKLYYSKDFFYENQEKNAQRPVRTQKLTTSAIN